MGRVFSDAAVWRRWFCLVTGCLLYALGVNLFLDANEIAAGGLAGLATVLTRVLPLRMSLLLVIMNVPLVIIAFFAKGWNFMKNSVAGFVLYAVFVELTSQLPVLTEDLLLAAIFGGAFYGAGMALVTIGDGSIGGTELINRMLAGLFPGVGLDGFCIMVDGSIILLSMAVFRKIEVGLYAILTLLICSKLVNRLVKRVVWGHRHGDMCLIVTSKSAMEVAEPLMKSFGVAVTKLSGVGMYSGDERTVLLAAVTEADTVRLRQVLMEIDASCFVTVLTADEVMGGKML